VLAQTLDEHRVSLAALFEATHERQTLLRAVHTHVDEDGVDVSGRIRAALVTGDWAEAWPEYFVPVAIGRRLIIVPPWIERVPGDRLPLVIDPGGFGTGHHATTAGCLEAIESLVAGTPPASAIDLGTGSGILAIAAARLGVADVLAVDTDTAAVAAAHANAARNDVAAQVRCDVADAAAVAGPPAPLVIANLLAAVHHSLAGRYVELTSPGGSLVLGGIEVHEAEAVCAAVEGAGFERRDQRTNDGWTTLVLTRRAQ
jgi:ribosomal protein L11 methyltransferase